MSDGVTCWFVLDDEKHTVTFDRDDLDSMGDDIFVFTAWIDPRDNGMPTIQGNLRGESPADEVRARGIDVDGPWFIWEREIEPESNGPANAEANAGGKPGQMGEK